MKIVVRFLILALKNFLLLENVEISKMINLIKGTLRHFCNSITDFIVAFLKVQKRQGILLS